VDCNTSLKKLAPNDTPINTPRELFLQRPCSWQWGMTSVFAFQITSQKVAGAMLKNIWNK
jgi:hypothetical protein